MQHLPGHMRTWAVLGVLTFLSCFPLGAEDWPQWRGPTANGISGEKEIPTKWSREENISWKTRLPGWGASTPIVWQGLAVVTSQVGDGLLKDGGGPEFRGASVARRTGQRDGVDFVVQTFHAASGKLAWEYRLPAEGSLTPVHAKNNLASSSPITDGELVYAWFGTGQLLALTMNGKLVWKRHLGKDVGPFDIRWGHGSSPMLYQDSLILLCDHPPSSYLLALDKRTGRRTWMHDRGDGFRSYTTPFLVEGRQGDELIINTNRHIEAVDPTTGKTLWKADEPNQVPVSTPVQHDGIVYSSRGHRSGPYLAIRAGGEGNVSESHVKWRVATGAPYVSSLLYYQGLLYMATERGIVTCIEAESGEIVWRERLQGVFSASPVAADGKVYLTNEAGETFVLAAGREFKILARNPLGERTVGSLAISNGRIFLRTDDHLFSIGKED